MKVTKKLILGEYGSPERMELLINGEEKFSIGEGEPEDMTLGRDLNPCLGIPKLMQIAYDAGKNGEDFEIEVIKVSEEE